MLITIDEAIRHLRIDEIEATDPDFLMDLQDKINSASVLCARYVNENIEDYLDSSGAPVDVPYHLKAAIKIWLGILFKHRDGEMDETLDYGQIPRSVSNILVMYRKPPIA